METVTSEPSATTDGSTSFTPGPWKTRHNAKLIEAAPQMLDALWSALILVEADEVMHGRLFGTGNQIRAAIEAATGERPPEPI